LEGKGEERRLPIGSNGDKTIISETWSQPLTNRDILIPKA